MKRFTTLAFALVLVLAAAAAAAAADIKATGEWRIEALWGPTGWDFTGRNDPAGLSAGKSQSFSVWTRVRTQFEFVANENLKGVLGTEIGSNKWGASGVYDLGNTPVAVGVRQAYVDFNWPGTKVNVRAGPRIGISLPVEVGGGSHILDDKISAALVSVPLADSASVLVGYLRALSGPAAYSPAVHGHGFMDLGLLSVPLRFEGVRLNPFFVAGYSASQAVAQTGSYPTGLYAQNATAEGGRNVFWAGLSFGVDLLDPIKIKGDVNYGQVGAKNVQNKMSGWLADLSVEYTGFSFVTPELFFVYTTGESGNATTHSGKSGRMPQLTQENWGVGSFFFGGDALITGSIAAREASTGFWTAGLSLKNMSLVEKLAHTVHVLYIQGTNNKDIGAQYTTAANQGNVRNIQYGRTLTTKDSVWEIDLNSKYPIYPELTAYLEMGLLFPSFSKSVWGDSYGGSTAHKVSLGLSYEF